MTDDQKRYETERHALFFKEEACKKLYKDHVEHLVNRVNSVSGWNLQEQTQYLAAAQHNVLLMWEATRLTCNAQGTGHRSQGTGHRVQGQLTCSQGPVRVEVRLTYYLAVLLPTGKKYKNDPTILAWNLINEPRCETWVPANSWCHQAMADWFKVGPPPQEWQCLGCECCIMTSWSADHIL